MYVLLGSDNIWSRYNYLKIWNLRVKKIEILRKSPFKVVQIKFLAMHITKQKLSFDIFTVRNVQNLHGTWYLLNILMIFGIKEKSIILTYTIYVLAIATNIPQRLKTGFVVQGHILCKQKLLFWMWLIAMNRLSALFKIHFTFFTLTPTRDFELHPLNFGTVP